jgi:hypothetical protein
MILREGERANCKQSLDENFAIFGSKCRRISNLLYITASVGMIVREGFDASGLKYLGELERMRPLAAC